MKEGVKLNKKIGLFLVAAALAMTISGCSGSATSGKVASSAPDGRDYERIVVISDLHYPTKTGTDDPELRQYKIDNKQKCLQEINGWDDVDLVAFPGDMVALTGTMDEMNTVKAFTDNLNKPKVFTAGNHEIFYRDVFTKKGDVISASESVKKQHLENYQKVFSPLHSTKEMMGYLLIFLSTDDVTGNLPTEMSKDELEWFKKTLDANKKKPTIVFFHAPLTGTLIPYNDKVGSPRSFAQPSAKIDQILILNPQIKLWVSGHTHTPPTQPTFDNDINYYHGKILDVYNPTWDGKTIWTNSLYLYKDKIVIKTYDMDKHETLDNLTRTVQIDR